MPFSEKDVRIVRCFLEKIKSVFPGIVNFFKGFEFLTQKHFPVSF